MTPAVERLVGTALRRVRAGERHLVWTSPAVRSAPDGLVLASPAFADGGTIPQRFAGIGVGDNVSPPLAWSGVPTDAAELVLAMQEPDALLLRPVVHAIASIPPDWTGLPQGAFGQLPAMPLQLGKGFFGRRAYAGPRLVRKHGPHRYVFQLFATGRRLEFAGLPDVATLTAALQHAVLSKGRLCGIFERDWLGRPVRRRGSQCNPGLASPAVPTGRWSAS